MSIIHRAISTHIVNKAGFTNKQAKTGAVTLRISDYPLVRSVCPKQ